MHSSWPFQQLQFGVICVAICSHLNMSFNYFALSHIILVRSFIVGKLLPHLDVVGISGCTFVARRYISYPSALRCLASKFRWVSLHIMICLICCLLCSLLLGFSICLPSVLQMSKLHPLWGGMLVCVFIANTASVSFYLVF